MQEYTQLLLGAKYNIHHKESWEQGQHRFYPVESTTLDYMYVTYGMESIMHHLCSARLYTKYIMPQPLIWERWSYYASQFIGRDIYI